ncbi:MAG TPA: NusG domain II-containing protein [Clostridia bacterium]|nr:NusG domain II-containing protein [Clostridia bacterium]
MKLKKGDLIIVIILAVAAISWFWINNMSESKDERQIVVETNGNFYKSIPIEAGMKKQKVHIDFEDGKYIDILIDENGAYVKDVICPDKVCQKTGVVNKVGQSIVCLPNKVAVYVEGKTESEVDDISF